MRITDACLAAAAIALVGVGATAQAKTQQQSHVMTVQLPFGGTEIIRYSGDAAPTVTWSDAGPFAKFDPFVGFADFDRIFATMNRQMADFDRQIAALERNAANASANGVYNAAAGGANAGFCVESIQVTQSGNKAPHVVRHTYGACAAPRAETAAPAAAGQRT